MQCDIPSTANVETFKKQVSEDVWISESTDAFNL